MAAVIGALRVNLGLNSAEFEQGMKKAQGALGGIGKAFAALGGIGVFAGFSAGIGAAVGRIEEMRKLTAQLDQALANTGNTAQTSGKEVEQFADRLERSTGRAAEEIMAVSTNLATFGFNRQVFFEAIELADDMAAAWGGDLRQNVEGLARALADPEKGLAMLTKRGITFTDQQKAMIASFMQANDLLGAQGVILDALQEQVSGVAEAGFGGLAKAQANATLAIESFFETIANSLGVNAGLEMSLVAVAAALDFVTANIDVLAKGAAIAGSAIAVALGPTVWALVSASATAMSATVLAGLNAIKVALLANPVGVLIAALAAAVTAAFMFRDEIKQAIGIDVVEIAKSAGNMLIQSFDLAFRNISTIWGSLPAVLGDITISTANAVLSGIQSMINGAIGAINSFTQGARGALGAIGIEVGDIGEVSIGTFDNKWEGAIGNVGAQMAQNLKDTGSIDYLGKLASALNLVGTEGSGAAANIAALGAAFDGGGEGATSGSSGGGGGAAGGARNLGAAVDETKEKLAGLGSTGQSVTNALKDGFKDLFKGLITGTGNAMDAVSSLLSKLGDLFLDNAFNLLLSGLGGGFGGGLGGIFGGIGKLFGFARGGTIMPGGVGGIDSQLVAFRKSPNERVDITKPGQTLTTGTGGEILVSATMQVIDGNLVPVITQVSGQVAGQQIKSYDRQLPNRMQDIQMRQG